MEDNNEDEDENSLTSKRKEIADILIYYKHKTVYVYNDTCTLFLQDPRGKELVSDNI